MCDTEIHNERVREAAEQLCRYSGEPYYLAFGDVLDALASLNDDLYHMRAIECIEEEAKKAKDSIDKIVGYARNQNSRGVR